MFVHVLVQFEIVTKNLRLRFSLKSAGRQYRKRVGMEVVEYIIRAIGEAYCRVSDLSPYKETSETLESRVKVQGISEREEKTLLVRSWTGDQSA